MRRCRFLYILFLMTFVSSLHAQISTFQGQVMDAKTGERMPFVHIYVDEERGCVSNAEGKFSIAVKAEDSLRFSFVGYQTCSWKASELPKVVRMSPAALAISNVNVLSDDAILKHAYEVMKRDFKVHKQEKRLYFNRMTMRSGEQEVMVEDFLTAASVVNVRNMHVVSGQYWTRTVSGEAMPSQLRNTNLHGMLEIAPMMPQTLIGNTFVLPFPEDMSSDYIRQFYTLSTHVITDGEDLIYVVELKPKENFKGSILYGKLYIDANTFRLYRFDGELRGLAVNVRRVNGPTNESPQMSMTRLHTHYTYTKGFGEVDNVSCTIHTEKLDISMLLVNAEGVDVPLTKTYSVKDNLLDAIDAAGVHPKLQKEKQLILRTDYEQGIAENDRKGPSSTSMVDESTRVLSYIQKAMNFNKVVPQEKVYLHFDNMGYFENETLWFKAYVTRTDNGRATDLSKVLYVELLNPSGDVLKTQKYPIDSLGQAHGDMKLDTLFGSGFYEVRAYTRYMTNWGVNAVFSRVFPIFKAPKEEGKYDDLTIREMLYKHRDPNNRDRTDSLYLKAIDEGIYTSDLMKTVSVQFYPEGGNLIQGKRCRVAMLAVDDNGRPYKGEGFVTNSKGDTYASVKTDSLGRGMFELIPDSNQLILQMKNLKDKVQKFPLPAIQQEGCVLKLDAVSEQMLATLQCTDGLCGHLLGYVLMHNGNIIYCDTVMASPLIEIELDRQKQEEGVSQLTVFDSKGEIVAERLFFICPKQNDADSIRIVAKTERLKPCGKVELELQARPNAFLSFSAMDAETMTNGKQGNMKTWMLLSSEVKGYIHNIDYYFEADDKEHRASADLLMMTQGWRRYDWNLMSGRTTFEKSQPIEDQFYVFGKLNVYRKRNPVSNVGMEVYLYNQQGQSLSGTTTTDKEGNYIFAMPFVDGEWGMQIFTKKTMKDGDEKRKTYYVGIDRQFSPTARYITPLEAEIQHPLKANAFVRKPFEELTEEDEFIPITEKNHVIQNVTVKAKRRYFTNDDFTYKNEKYGSQHATLYYNVDKERDDVKDMGEDVPYMFDWLAKRNPLFAYDDKNWTVAPKYDGRPIQWVVDNGGRRMATPVHELWLDEVKSIYIVPNHPEDTDGSVRIYVYEHITFTTESQKGLRRTYFQGFNIPSTFQMEDYNVIPPMADFRRTIYWNPDIRTDKEGKAKVEFFNNSTCQEMYISAEGMTEDGKILIQ